MFMLKKTSTKTPSFISFHFRYIKILFRKEKSIIVFQGVYVFIVMYFIVCIASTSLSAWENVRKETLSSGWCDKFQALVWDHEGWFCEARNEQILRPHWELMGQAIAFSIHIRNFCPFSVNFSKRTKCKEWKYLNKVFFWIWLITSLF